MTDRTLDRKTLRKELDEGKTRSEIADKHDLTEKTISSLKSEYEIETRAKLSDVGYGSRTAVIKEHELEEAGFDPDTELYYDKEVRDGEIVIKPTEGRVVKGE